MYKATTAGLLVGSLGDVGLQSLLKIQDENYGLKQYFEQHGPLESSFIAGGMIATFGGVYHYFDPSMDYLGLAAWGASLDVVFRETHKKIFPSLSGYYEKLSPLTSIIWGAIPMMMVGLIYRNLG